MEAKDAGVGNCQECGAELSAPGLSRSLAHSVPLQKTIGDTGHPRSESQRQRVAEGDRWLWSFCLRTLEKLSCSL